MCIYLLLVVTAGGKIYHQMIEFWAVLGLLSFLWTVKVAESEDKFARIFLLTVIWIITHYTILAILRSVEDISCFRWIKNIQVWK